MNLKIISIAMLALAAPQVDAARQAPQKEPQQPAPAAEQAETQAAPETVAVQTLSFDEIKQACLNPAKFHNQVAPKNIQISCGDVQYRWVPDTQGTLSMGTARYVKASVLSDKYVVDAVTATVDTTPQVANCPRFKQVGEYVETVRTVDCDDIIGFAGDATEFCVTSLNSLRGSNKDAISIQDTGNTLSLCGDEAPAAKGDQMPSSKEGFDERRSKRR